MTVLIQVVQVDLYYFFYIGIHLQSENNITVTIVISQTIKTFLTICGNNKWYVISCNEQVMGMIKLKNKLFWSGIPLRHSLPKSFFGNVKLMCIYSKNSIKRFHRNWQWIFCDRRSFFVNSKRDIVHKRMKIGGII